VKVSVFIFAALLVPSAAAAANVPTPAQTLALVKASPQLKIDKTVPATETYDAKTQPYVDVLGTREGQTIGGYLDAKDARHGTLTSGFVVLAVPLDSGGSGGVFTQLVFARRGAAAFFLAGHIDSGGHLDVQIKNGAIVATMPYYGPKDPNCCPSKMIVQQFTIRDNRLQRTSQRTVQTPKP
jgi:hypothetical protein